MLQIKDLYVIEWMGPYKSLDDMYQWEDVVSCFIYIITGRFAYKRSLGIKYIGITKRAPYIRLNDKDHQIKQEEIKCKQYWAGRFSISSYNILTDKKRYRAENVENLLIRYLSRINGVSLLNEKKRFKDPGKPIGIISLWKKRNTNDIRYYKPSILSKLPDTLIYMDHKFYVGEKIKIVQ